MTVRQALETTAILAKHLRTYSPFIAAIGSSKDKSVRQELIARLAAQLLTDADALTELTLAIENLTGAKGLSIAELLSRLNESWRVNGVDQLFSLCRAIGILADEDIANLVWAKTNWKTEKQL